MDVVLQCLLKDKCKMGTLGAVAIMIGAFVIYLGHCHIEHSLCSLDLARYLREISDFKRGPILVYHVHHRNIVEEKVAVFYPKFGLRPVKSLFDQIDVLVLHNANPSKLVCLFLSNPSESDSLYSANIFIIGFICQFLSIFEIDYESKSPYICLHALSRSARLQYDQSHS